ncbi:hypothetical protein V8F06_000260 [Rhypophila decipiens]
MFASRLLGVVTALAALAVAQNQDTSLLPVPTGTPTASSSTTGTSTTSTTSGPATHSVAVGAEGFVFSPNQIKANVGDTIRYVFYPGGHSVARSDFKFPCIPYEYAGLHRTGFWSGTKTPQAATGNVWYDVKVNDTDPIFFYCAAPGSCVDHHMIGVVNPSSNETFDEQMAYAQRVKFQLAPGDPWPSETAGNMPSETGSDNNDPGSKSSSSGDDHPHLSAGAIAGIAIGSAAVLVLAAALLYICGRRGGFDKAYRKSVAPSHGRPQSPSMVEQPYAGSNNPKSPGQGTFSTYSGVPDHDPYRSHTTSPQHPYYNGSHNGSPPPVFSGNLHPVYPHQLNGSPQGPYPQPMGELSAQHYSPPPQPPVELPTTTGLAATTPVSPPPQYPNSARRDSWTAGEEGLFPPRNK